MPLDLKSGFDNPAAKHLLKIRGVSTESPEEKKLNFSSGHIKCSSSTPQKIYCSEADQIKNIVKLCPANYSGKILITLSIFFRQKLIFFRSKSNNYEHLYSFLKKILFRRLLRIRKKQFWEPYRELSAWRPKNFTSMSENDDKYCQ